MDKFTVDLDQVLNDFEYSELTDSYGHERATGSEKIQHHGVTKHSINNVFHSLNEYLNTSISGNNVVKDSNISFDKIDNIPTVNKKNFEGEDSKNVILDELGCNEKVKENISPSVIEKTETDMPLDSLVKNEDILMLSLEQSPNIVQSDPVKSIVENHEITSSLVAEEKTKDCNRLEEHIIEESKGSVEKSEVPNDVIDEEICLVEKNCDLKNQNLEKANTQIIQDETGTNDIIQIKTTEEATIVNVSLEKQDSQEKIKDCDETQEIETVSKIGFEDEVNLDETEINRLLAELEDEDELQESQVEEAARKEELVVVEIGEKHKEKVCEERKGNHEEEIINNAEEEICLKEEKGESSDKNNESERELCAENLDQSNKNQRDVNDDNDNEEKEKVIADKNEKQIQEIIESEEITKRALENVSEVSEDKKVKIEKEVSEESLSRPQNLSLNNESVEDGKRKINLIGEPGSTPYNNVYINKEIPKRKPQPSNDSDTEYSTSASPTFSDISTASTSTASTASIEGVQEKIAEEEKKVSVTSAEGATDVGNGDAENLTQHEETPEIPSAEDEAAGPAASSQTETADPSQIGAGEARVEDMAAGNISVVALDKAWLGREAPLWIPDSDAMSCLHCDMKFTVLKRRHHCRACGLVLCSKCCSLRFKLEYLVAEARVCNKCYDILNRDTNSSSGSEVTPEAGNSPSFRPNPNNPSEYCSTVSPLEQVGSGNQNPPSVMVPVGVLKRKGSNKAKTNKSVMFCDGIKPGSDLTNLDSDFNYQTAVKLQKRGEAKETKAAATPPAPKPNRNQPKVDAETRCFISSCETSLPPTVTTNKTDICYSECSNNPSVVEMLKNEALTFAIHVNLLVHLRIINMNCCINKSAWCFSTEGLINVGNDEIVILLEYIEEESFVPKDIFFHINNIYADAVKGTSVKEMGLSLHNKSYFLDSKNHAGFVYIRPTFQCLENVIKPSEPFLIGILIHRWETPWAKLFPLRLILRLGAEYRYYPSPIISTRHRDSVFVEIGHTIINLLADFRNFSYTLPQIRGLTIHMEDKNTTITIPVNRYDQVMKSINNSSDHILAFAGNFSLQADSHLVCIQDTQSNDNSYSTHAINIHNKPRKVTGASFLVFNGALKSSSGLTAKSNIVEDGLMIQILPERMAQIRESLRAMKDHTIACGCANAAAPPDESVTIVWGENDTHFNIGVKSPVDNMAMNGIPSIRVHNGKDFICNNGSRLIRWTEVFIIQNGEENPKNQDPVDISKVSESIAKATCNALVQYLDLLVTNSFYKMGIRATLHVENVSYSAGSNGLKLPPIYMKSLDNELIPVLHKITSNNLGDNAVVLELIFRILNV